jgi:predicted nucleic acid-binding protein
VTRYLLDTSTLIDLSKNRPGVSDGLNDLPADGHEIGVCDVSVAEFFSGLRPVERGRWEAYVLALQFWPTSRGAAILAGAYRYAFARQGRAISAPDALIAAVAVEVGATVVTNNVKDYPMPGLQVLRLGAGT